MGIKYRGDLPIGTSFEVRTAQPFDSRAVVETISDLTNRDIWTIKGLFIAYLGLTVFVEEDQSLYSLVEVSDPLIWKKQGTNEDIINKINKISPITVQVDTDNGNIVFTDESSEPIRTIASTYIGNVEVSDDIESWRYSWERTSEDPTADLVWNALHKEVGREIVVTEGDLVRKAKFECLVNIEGLDLTKYLT